MNNNSGFGEGFITSTKTRPDTSRSSRENKEKKLYRSRRRLLGRRSSGRLLSLLEWELKKYLRTSDSLEYCSVDFSSIFVSEKVSESHACDSFIYLASKRRRFRKRGFSTNHYPNKDTVVL